MTKKEWNNLRNGLIWCPKLGTYMTFGQLFDYYLDMRENEPEKFEIELKEAKKELGLI